MTHELEFGPYLWPKWVRYPIQVLFRIRGTDGLTRWERERFAARIRAGETAWRKVSDPEHQSSQDETHSMIHR